MTKQEAIKFLQELYPVGGHCWLDEQRIEAIGMAIKALQEEPVKRTPADIEAAMQEVEEKSRVFTEAHKGEDADTILAQMRGEEPVGEDLGEYIDKLSKQFPEVSFAKLSRIAVRVAKWQREQMEKEYSNLNKGLATAKGLAVTMAYDKGVADAKEQMMKNLWKPADGDDLPEIDREVIALLSNGKVVYAHRPQEYWDGKNIATEEVTRYYPARYDKGGWNISDIKFWLDCELPIKEE